ncbi:MAG: hypothetical protein QOJ48_1214 [Frankiales bacterium]|nr:hypothetical protein [Frankiales bacterium]
MSTQLAAEGRSLSTRAKILIGVGGVIVLFGMLIAGFNILLGPPKLVEVVTMTQDATEEDRQALKDACGGLPGITVVPDQGNPSPEIQGRFPVRFDLGHATTSQRIALESCINAHGSKVRGFLAEGDN